MIVRSAAAVALTERRKAPQGTTWRAGARFGSSPSRAPRTCSSSSLLRRSPGCGAKGQNAPRRGRLGPSCRRAGRSRSEPRAPLARSPARRGPSRRPGAPRRRRLALADPSIVLERQSCYTYENKRGPSVKTNGSAPRGGAPPRLNGSGIWSPSTSVPPGRSSGTGGWSAPRSGRTRSPAPWRCEA